MQLKVDLQTDQSLAHVLGVLTEDLNNVVGEAKHDTEKILQGTSEKLPTPLQVSVKLEIGLRRSLGELETFTKVARAALDIETKRENAKLRELKRQASQKETGQSQKTKHGRKRSRAEAVAGDDDG